MCTPEQLTPPYGVIDNRSGPIMFRGSKTTWPNFAWTPLEGTDKKLYKGEDYNTEFDPKVFLSTYFSDVTGHADKGDHMEFMMDSLHGIFSDGELRGRRLLDVGTGPSIHTIISAGKHVDEIYLSDFSKPNREVLQDWKKGRLTHSFETFFKYIVDKEGNSESAGAREEETRTKVKDIFFVDLLSDSWPELSSQQPYDVIITSRCLESLAPTIDVYHSIFERLVALLKPNGFLVIIGVLGVPYYKVGEKHFYALTLTESDTKEICTRCNLDLLHWESTKLEMGTPTTELGFKRTLAMVAKKVKSQ
ncbi:nicotinamide N-methyltransferase-like isoform X1 [Gigantopelta aegis]|uniref:nicotinamide N-methyltransferase-like isoform X1 n=1 Tax=Gigantopelta aegis TaxID=1735272 RepID=UPI001B88C696|nr:nicotinamide N-methyltransferase-like isoform X1 [Gigantopelta aegis]